MTDEQATAQAGREAFAKSPDSIFVREMKAVMRLYQQARAEGVSREDAERGIELVLRAQWTKPPTKFPDDCDLCDDTGWRERICTHEMRCTRLNRAQIDHRTMHPSFEHNYFVPCDCPAGDQHRKQTPTADDAIAAAGRTAKKKRGFSRPGE